MSSGDRDPRVAALILAAGASSRMRGANKLLARVDGESVVARVADAALASRAERVVVVTGHEAAGVAAALGGRAIALAQNPDYARGLSSSLRMGLEALVDAQGAQGGRLESRPTRSSQGREAAAQRGEAERSVGAREGSQASEGGPLQRLDGALILLGDMPWVSAAHLDALISAFAARPERPICVPTFERRRGNPVLWPARYFAALCAQRGDAGGRDLLRAHAAEVLAVAMSDAGVTLDVDTSDDLARAPRERGA